MKKFLPTWLDGEGNRFFIVSLDQVFDSFDAAVDKQLELFLSFLAFGATKGSILEVEMTPDHKIEDVEYLAGTVNGLIGNFPVAFVSGPLFEKGRLAA